LPTHSSLATAPPAIPRFGISVLALNRCILPSRPAGRPISPAGRLYEPFM